VFELFTDAALRVLASAQDESRSFGHLGVGTEHLLLGLLLEGDGGGRALASLGVTYRAARAEVQELVGAPPGLSDGKIPLSSLAKRVLELSTGDARRSRHDQILPEHILLGLASVAEGCGAQVLLDLGLELDQVREAALRSLAADR